MTATLLLCHFTVDLEHSLKQWCGQQLPSVSIQSLSGLLSLSDYLGMKPPYDRRDYPAPHLVFYYFTGDIDSLTNEVSVLRAKEFGRKVPFIIMCPQNDRNLMSQLYQLPISAVVPMQEGSQRDAAILRATLEYWTGVVQLPFV